MLQSQEIVPKKKKGKSAVTKPKVISEVWNMPDYDLIYSNSKDNMLDYNKQRVGTKENVVMAEQIRTVDKRRLRRYIGIMNQEFMEKIQKIIDISLQLQRNKITKKIEFENQYIEGLLSRLLKIIYESIVKKKISEKEIGKRILTAVNEISMRYHKKDCIPFSIGDVVDCNYGVHLEGEVNGDSVAAIVCNISNTGMVYVVPITKQQKDIISDAYLKFTVPVEINYYRKNYSNGTILFDKGNYVSPKRFNEVIGKTSPEFFLKILNQLASTFDFRNSLKD